jgi:hypothetical protein
MSIALEPSGAWATAAVYRYTDSNRQYDSEQLMVKRAVLEPLDRPLQPLRMRDRAARVTPKCLAASVTNTRPIYRRSSPGWGGFCIRLTNNVSGSFDNAQASSPSNTNVKRQLTPTFA